MSLSEFIDDAVKAKNISPSDIRDEKVFEIADALTKWNLEESQRRIIAESPCLRSQIKKGKIGMATGFFNRSHGKIEFSGLNKIVLSKSQMLK